MIFFCTTKSRLVRKIHFFAKKFILVLIKVPLKFKFLCYKKMYFAFIKSFVYSANAVFKLFTQRTLTRFGTILSSFGLEKYFF